MRERELWKAVLQDPRRLTDTSSLPHCTVRCSSYFCGLVGFFSIYNLPCLEVFGQQQLQATLFILLVLHNFRLSPRTVEGTFRPLSIMNAPARCPGAIRAFLGLLLDWSVSVEDMLWPGAG